jgi:hypothetical protein
MKALSFCMITFSASLTKLMVLQPQSHDCSCCVSRKVLAHSLSGYRNTLIYAHMNLYTFPACDIILGLLTLHVPEARELVELMLIHFNCMDAYLLKFC